jgi:serine/threonine protein kinase
MTMTDSNTQDSTRQLIAGRYRLTDVIRQEGTQVAWQAEDQELSRQVAVTELRGDKQHSEPVARRRLVARMLREAEVMALVCPGRVLTALDIVEEEGKLWTVTEIVDARPLDEILIAEGTLDAVHAARIGLELLAVLTAAHREGITHGDVRPSYVLVRPDGQVVLGGFGVTAAQTPAPSYASPERARGELPGPSSDLWSLGAVLYAMVEGRPPYRDRETPAATLAAVLNEPVVPPRHAGPLALAIKGLLRKDPLERTDDPVVRRVLNRIIGEADNGEEPADLLTPGARGTSLARRAEDPRPGGRHRPAVWRTTIRGRSVSWTPTTLGVVAGVLLVASTATVATVVTLDGRSPAATSAAAPDPSTSAGSRTPSSPASSSPSSGASASSAGEATEVVPKDYSQRVDPEGFSIALPDTFGRLGDNGHGTGSLFGTGGDPRTLLVDWTHTPGDDPVAAWQKLEQQVSGSIDNYHLIDIESVDYRGWKTADWEWTSTIGGVRYRTIDRGFVVDSKHGYAIRWSVPEAVWYSEENQQALRVFFSSFKPAA